MKARVLFYVQHLLGVGHLKRAEVLAQAIQLRGLDVTVALGGRPVPEVPFRSVQISELPPASIAGEDFSTLLDGAGNPVDGKWKATRTAALLELARYIDPDVILIELFPFGRRQFGFELLPLLEAVRRTDPRPMVACSVRDVLVTRKPGRAEEAAAVARHFFDAVLVHGDPTLIPFGATFGAADAVADLVRYTGYVAEPTTEAAPASAEGEVLVSAGGGAVGAPLFFAALAARPMTALADRTWRFLAGPNLPADDYGRLAAAAGPGTIVERFRPDFSARLGAAALSISQAGYNTTMDILRSGARAVVVPYEARGETEQRLRSDFLAEKGLLTVVPAAELSPGRLAEAVAEALAKPRPPSGSVDLAGAPETARLVAELAGRRRGVSRGDLV